MRALTIDAPATLALADIADPARPGECRVRVRRAGICGTDLHLLAGYAGFRGVPGHEFVGVVEDAPPDAVHWIGRRVVGEINVGCGRCGWCRSGVKEHCADRSVLGIRDRAGAFAERLWLPAANLHAVPDALDDEAAVFVEPTAAACQILMQVDLDARTRVAVVGDGRLGLIVAQVLRSTGASVLVLGRHARKLDVARSLGIEAQAVDRTTVRREFDVVVDATGRPEGLGRALDLVRPRGTIVLKSTFHGEGSAELWPIVVNEVQVVGSRCGPFDRAIAMLAGRVVQTAPLVAATFPLEEFDAAFAAARRELKVLFRVSE